MHMAAAPDTWSLPDSEPWQCSLAQPTPHLRCHQCLATPLMFVCYTHTAGHVRLFAHACLHCWQTTPMHGLPPLQRKIILPSRACSRTGMNPMWQAHTIMSHQHNKCSRRGDHSQSFMHPETKRLPLVKTAHNCLTKTCTVQTWEDFADRLVQRQPVTAHP